MSQKSKKNSSIRSNKTKTHKLSKLEPSNNEIIVIEKKSEKQQENKVDDNLPYYQKTLLTYSGFILALCATIYLTISYYIIKLSKSLNASDMGAIKFSITMICCLFVAIYYKQNIFGPKNSRLLLLGRGITGSIALILNFFSIQMINYGDSTVIRNTSPVVTAIFAQIFLKEKLNISHIISLFISFAGILFVARPPILFGSLINSSNVKFDSNFILGISLSILSIFAIGSAFVFIKKLTKKEVHFSVIIFYLSAIGCLLCSLTSIILLFTGLSHKEWDFEKKYLYRDIGLAVISGFINFIGHICFTLALIKENANTISIMRTLDIIMAFLLEYLVVGVIPDLFSFIGAILVITSVCVLFIYKFITHESSKIHKKVYRKKENKVFRV